VGLIFSIKHLDLFQFMDLATLWARAAVISSPHIKNRETHIIFFRLILYTLRNFYPLNFAGVNSVVGVVTPVFY